MAISKIKVTFTANIQDIWNIVTSLENYQWRSDISKIEVLNEKQFVEYTKEGFPTTFTVTATEIYKRWEFDIENSNIRGHWSGTFSQVNGHTEIVFTEDVTAKKWFMKSFVKSFLKKQQNQYITDLKKTLHQ